MTFSETNWPSSSHEHIVSSICFYYNFSLKISNLVIFILSWVVSKNFSACAGHILGYEDKGTIFSGKGKTRQKNKKNAQKYTKIEKFAYLKRAPSCVQLAHGRLTVCPVVF